MHSERDILTSTVFPMLRAKLAPYLISVHEVDLRWGITDAEAKNNETLDICLGQVLDAEYFVSMLGERYGLILPSYQNSQKLAWLDAHPPGASITELEIECQLNKRHTNAAHKYETSFFYFRDAGFLKNVPANALDHFVDESDQSRQKLAQLKSRIMRRSNEVCDVSVLIFIYFKF